MSATVRLAISGFSSRACPFLKGTPSNTEAKPCSRSTSTCPLSRSTTDISTALSACGHTAEQPHGPIVEAQTRAPGLDGFPGFPERDADGDG